MHRRAAIVAVAGALALALTLGACGQKGPLKLPPEPPRAAGAAS